MNTLTCQQTYGQPEITDEEFDAALAEILDRKCLNRDVEWFLELPGFRERVMDRLNDEIIEKALEMKRGEN